MRFRCLLFVLALAITAQAKAQIGVYGTFTGSHLGGLKAPYPYTDSSSYWAIGGGFGVYDDFTHIGPVRIGADLRGSILNSNGHKLNSGLVGARFAFKSPVIPVKPYLQASVGIGSTNYGANSAMTSGLLYQIFGGLDFTVLPRLDWRVIEIGGGALHTFKDARVGTNFPVGTISTGIVFRLP